jgi:hypothetical protein
MFDFEIRENIPLFLMSANCDMYGMSPGPDRTTHVDFLLLEVIHGHRSAFFYGSTEVLMKMMFSPCEQTGIGFTIVEFFFSPDSGLLQRFQSHSVQITKDDGSLRFRGILW